MHLRKTNVKRKSDVYTYVQLVESYRREHDGLPATRVIANLGQISETQFKNLQIALDASRKGKSIVIKEEVQSTISNILLKPMQNLEYLAIAVLIEIWREYDLEKYCENLFKPNHRQIDDHNVLIALVLHRCIDPDSKLATTRWYPRTMLPEWIGVPTQSFNNTRIHRTLELIEKYDSTLMAKLPYLQQKSSTPKFASLFLDVTDTWFVGHGPETAKKGKTKEGILSRKIGIVLLCDQDGFPLRWEVVSGTAHDSKTMTEMIDSVKNLSWTKNTPLVCDRAMGTTSTITEIHKKGIHFLTAISRSEFNTYAKGIPTLIFGESYDASDRDKTVIIARQAARNTNDLIEIDENLFVMDCGIVNKNVVVASNLGSSVEERGDIVASSLSICKQINQAVDDGQYSSFQAAGSSMNLTKGLVYRYRLLGRLPLDIQDRIKNGEAKNCSIDDIIALIKSGSKDDIEIKFSKLIEYRRQKPARIQIRCESSQESENYELALRVVVYFNPEVFAEKKHTAWRLIDRVSAFEKDLNKRIKNSKNRSSESVMTEVRQYLSKEDLIDAYEIKIALCNDNPKQTLHVSLSLKEDVWVNRRRFDGYSVLICHPEITLNAGDICRLYRAKNTIETDFRTIKSFLEIRPVHHRTDAKVKAHVTICMLSLFLERALDKKLDGTMSAARAIEILKTCHLNRYIMNESSAYVVTEPDDEQLKILDKLNLRNLVNDDFVREKIINHR